MESDKISKMEENEYIALFGSVTKVMKAEKVLKKEGMGFTLIPSPRMILSPCGLAIRFKEADIKDAEKILEGKKLKITHLFLKAQEGYEKIY